MSADEDDQESTDEQQQPPGMDDLSDEGKDKVRQMQQAYDDDRPTAVLPGSDGTITGVAINKWLDDDGNPKFGKDKHDDDSTDEPDSADEHSTPEHDEDGTPKSEEDGQKVEAS